MLESTKLGCQHGHSIVKALFLSYKWLPSPSWQGKCPLTAEREQALWYIFLYECESHHESPIYMNSSEPN